MAGKAKKGSKRRGSKRAGAKSNSAKAGLVFPVGRCGRKLLAVRYAKRVGYGAGVFTAAALEYLCMEILDLAGQCADEQKRKQIKPRHIALAVRNDDELNKLLSASLISQGGVRPEVNEWLWGKGKK